MASSDYLVSSRGGLVDTLMQLKALGTVATTMVGEFPIGTEKSFDTGGGATKGNFITNVYATPASILPQTKFVLKLQGSKNAAFSTINDLQILEIGDSTQISGGSDLTTGKYILPFSNDLDGTVYRYLRHYLTAGGTCGTGMQYEVYLSKLAG